MKLSMTREQARINEAKYRSTHIQVLRERRRDYLSRNREIERDRRRKYRENPETKQKERIYAQTHREYRQSYNMKLYDWLFLQLGNKCEFCGSQVELEIDHVLGAWDKRASGEAFKTIHYLLQDYDNGEPLRILCKLCHKISHAFRV